MRSRISVVAFASLALLACSTDMVSPPTKAPQLVFNEAGTELVPDGCGVSFNYNGFIGTSQAAPHVSGLAALLVAEKGHANPARVKRLIEQSGDEINPRYGKGRINVKRALAVH